MTEPTTPKPRRRRWFALSLRGAMIAVLIVGGLLGWKARRASLQRRAVAAIERLQGSIVYDWQSADGYPIMPYVNTLAYNPVGPQRPQPPGWAWLRRMIGDEYFQEVSGVNLPDIGQFANAKQSDVDDLMQQSLGALAADQLACLDGLDGIKSLDLALFPLKPAAVGRLERLVTLKNLRLINNFEPANLARLGGLVHLETLTVDVTLRNDDDLVFLERMHRLRSLHLMPGDIDNAGLARLARLPVLEELTVEGPGVTDAGLAHLAAAKSLKSLTLQSAKAITDAGLAHLARIPALEDLDLSGTPVTEDGLELLGKIPKLARLSIPLDLICQPVLNAFKAARPGVAMVAGVPPAFRPPHPVELAPQADPSVPPLPAVEPITPPRTLP